MRRILDHLRRDTRGAVAIEYGLIVALIVIAIVGGIRAVGGATGGIWGNVANKVAAVMPNA